MCEQWGIARKYLELEFPEMRVDDHYNGKSPLFNASEHGISHIVSMLLKRDDVEGTAKNID